jgi:tetratricopeptide (TPR) repeat protein
MIDNSTTEWTKFAPVPRERAPGEKWHVFLSYRSVNRTWVLNLYDVLRGRGHTVFLDQCVLTGGDQLILELQMALEKSQTGVLIWTKASDSDWVRREYQVMERLAESKPGFTFVPIKLDESALPVFLASRIFLDFSTYPDGPNGGELLRLLHAINGQPLSAEAAHFAAAQDEEAMVVMARIRAAIKNNSPERLVELFEESGLAWETSAAPGCKAAEGLTRLGRNDLAIQLLEKLADRFPRAIRPKQLHALALARGGSFEAAQDILGQLYERGERDPETLGIYARTWMDRYYATQPRDIDYIKQSRDLYVAGFDLAQDDYYTGINAAAKSVLLGEAEDLDRAAELAERVKAIVGNEPQRGDDYWKIATMAEVNLIQKNYAEAARLYAAAVAEARWETGSQRSTWLQACRLMSKLQPTDQERARIRNVFKGHPDCSTLAVD